MIPLNSRACKVGKERGKEEYGATQSATCVKRVEMMPRGASLYSFIIHF